MKPPPFEYRRAQDLEEALRLLDEHGDEAKPLAGGQSLVAMMNLRLARPALLVDIDRIGLDGVEIGAGEIHVGALVRQARLVADEDLKRALPLLSMASAHVAHPAIRNRGTVGGSLVHADPTAELTAAALALDATLHVRSASGQRRIAAVDFPAGPFFTALRADELLTGMTVPRGGPHRRYAFLEVAERAGDFALAAVAVAVDVGDTLAGARVVLAGAGGVPLRAYEAEAAVEGQAPSPGTLREAARAAVAGLDVAGDRHAPATFKAHLLEVLVERSLAAATGAGEVHG